MGNRGYAFEKELADTFKQYFKGLHKKCYRIIGSGRNKNATTTGGDILEGDVHLELDKIPLNLKFLVEAKWYQVKGKTVKSMSIRKEWLDQARHEAEKNGMLCLFSFKMKSQNKNSKELKKYSFAGRDSNSTWICLPLKHFALLLHFFYRALDKDELVKQLREQERETKRWRRKAKELEKEKEEIARGF